MSDDTCVIHMGDRVDQCYQLTKWQVLGRSGPIVGACRMFGTPRELLDGINLIDGTLNRHCDCVEMFGEEMRISTKEGE